MSLISQIYQSGAPLTLAQSAWVFIHFWSMFFAFYYAGEFLQQAKENSSTLKHPHADQDPSPQYLAHIVIASIAATHSVFYLTGYSLCFGLTTAMDGLLSQRAPAPQSPLRNQGGEGGMVESRLQGGHQRNYASRFHQGPRVPITQASATSLTHHPRVTAATTTSTGLMRHGGPSTSSLPRASYSNMDLHEDYHYLAVDSCEDLAVFHTNVELAVAAEANQTFLENMWLTFLSSVFLVCACCLLVGIFWIFIVAPKIIPSLFSSELFPAMQRSLIGCAELMLLPTSISFCFIKFFQYVEHIEEVQDAEEEEANEEREDIPKKEEEGKNWASDSPTRNQIPPEKKKKRVYFISGRPTAIASLFAILLSPLFYFIVIRGVLAYPQLTNFLAFDWATKIWGIYRSFFPLHHLHGSTEVHELKSAANAVLLQSNAMSNSGSLFSPVIQASIQLSVAIFAAQSFVYWTKLFVLLYFFAVRKGQFLVSIIGSVFPERDQHQHATTVFDEDSETKKSSDSSVSNVSLLQCLRRQLGGETEGQRSNRKEEGEVSSTLLLGGAANGGGFQWEWKHVVMYWEVAKSCCFAFIIEGTVVDVLMILPPLMQCSPESISHFVVAMQIGFLCFPVIFGLGQGTSTVVSITAARSDEKKRRQQRLSSPLGSKIGSVSPFRASPSESPVSSPGTKGEAAQGSPFIVTSAMPLNSKVRVVLRAALKLLCVCALLDFCFIKFLGPKILPFVFYQQHDHQGEEATEEAQKKKFAFTLHKTSLCLGLVAVFHVADIFQYWSQCVYRSLLHLKYAAVAKIIAQWIVGIPLAAFLLYLTQCGVSMNVHHQKGTEHGGSHTVHSTSSALLVKKWLSPFVSSSSTIEEEGPNLVIYGFLLGVLLVEVPLFLYYYCIFTKGGSQQEGSTSEHSSLLQRQGERGGGYGATTAVRQPEFQ